jgi:hypothetical protein
MKRVDCQGNLSKKNVIIYDEIMTIKNHSSDNNSDMEKSPKPDGSGLRSA